ncbi:phosphoribosylamine--glycine ligase [Lactococcus termiticola]|uniref:Phosphoribosylamine--glycine ligase n=1 Tax=Lactococcus termiticola TaxID=2169526 RepID=A0A2R5HGI3_9LACT|nr:phosphoribosylamine--glycine ligase [Lactococcus termiticola]GBG97124.1 phosphoribosylamine-glycine ligase [Lactococcus termiticola]
MNILVIGAGGREHAIAKKMMESPLAERVYVTPGNPGMKQDGIEPVAISELDNQALVNFAKENKIGLTFVGPETALANGIVDAFLEAGLKIFGPTKEASEIEVSKDFAKALMAKYDVPTAVYSSFESLEASLSYVREQGAPIVIKADGLAAGKGVTVAMDLDTAEVALRDIFEGDQGKVVIEEYLEGEEFSLFSFVHEGRIYPMPIAQDHKRAFDGDKGPNTGGMGAYSPVPHIPEAVVNEAFEQVVKPTVAGMIAEGRSFTGVLYAGLMLTADGIKTIEFNARFGDPETQVVLPRLESDLLELILALLEGRKVEPRWEKDGVRLGVVIASEGYPGKVEASVKLPELGDDMELYYAGVTEKDGQLYSKGGRVLLVSASGRELAKTQQLLYDKLDKIKFDGLFYRHDIGSKGV